MTVMLPWTENLSYMMQSVLITACRGPDGITKYHPAKVLLRYLRRSFLYSAFDRKELVSPYEKGGGSFTGPCYILDPDTKEPSVTEALTQYLDRVDEIPLHFHFHLMHAAEILGYKHPNSETRMWWYSCYIRLVEAAHLNPERVEQLDQRLGDNEKLWEEASTRLSK
jgi:hypothetical protein